MKLSKDFKEFIELLNSRKAKYVVLGGYAVAYHGHPRFTGDMDFLIERSESNSALIHEVLKDFGFSNIGVAARDLLEPEMVIQNKRATGRAQDIADLKYISDETQ